ncbi:hypothetical protein FRB99_003999 [Tulasnella sp. 403]|nr:hypothetical protein FRB99_003999 [Tulasnella sp. 403]
MSSSGDLLSQWDASSDYRPTTPNHLKNYRFLLIGTVPQYAAEADLKQAFKPLGDLLGIYVGFLNPNGIVILAFHDSRHCLDAHLSLHKHNLFPRPLSSQLLNNSSLSALIGNSSFIQDADASLQITAQAFVNGDLLRDLLQSYGELSSFYSTDRDGLLYTCEYYDARHARAAIKGLDFNPSVLGVPIQVSQNTFSPNSSPATSSATMSVDEITTPKTPHFNGNDTVIIHCSPDFPQPLEHKPTLADRQIALTHLTSRHRPGGDHVLPPAPRIRRSSTGSAFVPGQSTALELERFRASATKPLKPSLDPLAPKPPVKLKETSAGLLLVDNGVNALGVTHSPASTLCDPSTPDPNNLKFALPPFMGALPPPLSSTAIWTGPDTQPVVPFADLDECTNSPTQVSACSSAAPDSPLKPSSNRRSLTGNLPPRMRPYPRSFTANPSSPFAPPLLPLCTRTSHPRDPPSPRNTIDLEKIATGQDTRTTIMIKNVPSRMTHQDMERFVNSVCEREYDFLYLRMDFVTGNNVGYAFVNFIEVASLLKFLTTYLGKRWNMYSSDKVMLAAYATYQGKAALVTKFQNSSILDRDESVQPHIYYTSGENKGLPEPFPAPNDSARKARSLAAANEYGLYSRMEPERRQRMSQAFQTSARNYTHQPRQRHDQPSIPIEPTFSRHQQPSFPAATFPMHSSSSHYVRPTVPLGYEVLPSARRTENWLDGKPTTAHRYTSANTSRRSSIQA